VASEQTVPVADPAEFQRALDFVRIGTRACFDNGVDDRAIITAAITSMIRSGISINLS
jgi:hypothetical protein